MGTPFQSTLGHRGKLLPSALMSGPSGPARLHLISALLAQRAARWLPSAAGLLFGALIGASVVPQASAQTSARPTPVPAPAARPPAMRDFGKVEYESRCASCHGINGKGSGPVGELLRKSPPDLTQLAKRNGGVFPMVRLYDSITGDTITAHGSRDMPVWGRVYREDAATYFMELPYDPEAYTRAQVLMLLEYIHRLQQK